MKTKPNQTLLLFLISLCLSIPQFAKANEDSLLSIWNSQDLADSSRYEALRSIIAKHLYSSPEKSLKHSNALIAYFKGTEEKEYLESAYNYKGVSHSILGNQDSARISFESSLRIAEEIMDSTGMAQSLINLGNFHSQAHHFVEAIDYFHAGIDIYQALKDTILVAVLNNNISQVFGRMKDWESALSYINIGIYESDRISSLKRDSLKTSEYRYRLLKNCRAQLYVNKGKALNELAEYEEAEKFLCKGIALHRANNNTRYIGYSYRRLAEVYSKQGIIDKALDTLEMSIQIMKECKFELGVNQALVLKAKLLFNQDFEQSIEIAKSILPYIEENDEDELANDLYRLLYLSYKKMGNNAMSLEMLEKHKAINDKTLAEDQRLAVSRQIVQREFEKEMRQQSYEMEKEQVQLKYKAQRERITIIVIALFLILFLLATLRIRYLKNSRLRNELLLEIERLKSEERSELKNNELAKRQGINKEALEEYIDKKLNDTDWAILNILLEKPEIQNKEIAEKVFLSLDGVGSSLRRMYSRFNIGQTKYKKISLIMKAIEISNKKVYNYQ